MKQPTPYPKKKDDHDQFVWMIENTHFPDLDELLNAFTTAAGPVLSLGCECFGADDLAKFMWNGPRRKSDPMDESAVQTARFKALKKMLIAGRDVRKALVEFHQTLEPIMEWRSEFTEQEWKELQAKGKTSTG